MGTGSGRGMRELFLRAAAGEWTRRPPVWMMRQAGRYLPEYRELRECYTFREAISTPDIAAEISLQPWHRFEPDGVVMYSDILTALEPLGLDYRIESGVGPVIEDPVRDPEDTNRSREPVEDDLEYVGELLERLSGELREQAAVLGFVGGPFTLAAYTVEGEPSKTFMELRRFRAAHPDAFRRLLERFTDVLVDFVQYQTAHGADAIQIFDTYAGLLSPADHRTFLQPLHQRITGAVDVPTILFARNVPNRLELLAETGADVIGLDWTNDIAAARSSLGSHAVQGNLDPAYLYGSPSFVREQTRSLISAAGPRGHILNLGHGIDKDTPIEGVTAFFDAAKSIDRGEPP